IRHRLCEKGYGWSRSDAEAAAIVTEALRVIGARRPTWAEGQPDHVIPIEACQWCGGFLESEYSAKQHASRKVFCSTRCSNASRNAALERALGPGIGRGNAASDLLNPFVPCRQCGKLFAPAKYTRIYCSQACQAAAY